MSYRQPTVALLDAGEAGGGLPPQKKRPGMGELRKSDNAAPKALQFPTKADMKIFSQRADDMRALGEFYRERVDAGTWEDVKSENWRMYNAINVLIQRGSLNEYNPPKAPSVTTAPKIMGVDPALQAVFNPNLASPPVSGDANAPDTAGALDATNTFATGAAETTLPTVVGGQVMRGVSLIPHPLAKIGAPIVGMAAGGLTSLAQMALGRLAMGDAATADYEQNRARQRRANPVPAFLGENLPAGIAFKPSATVKEAVSSGAVGGGINLATQVGRNVLAKPEDRRDIDLGEAAGATLANAISGGAMRGGGAARNLPNPPRTQVMDRVGPARTKPLAPPLKTGVKNPYPMAPPIDVKLAKGEVSGPPPPPIEYGPPAPSNKAAPASASKVAAKAAPVETPTQTAKPAPKPPTETPADPLQLHVDDVAAKYAKGEDVEPTSKLAKRLGITTEEALQVKQRAADTIEVKRQEKAAARKPRGRANIPVVKPVGPPAPLAETRVVGAAPVAKPAETPEVIPARAKTEPPLPTKPIHEMNRAELDANRAEVEAFEKAQDREILGEDYDRYRRAESVVNRTLADPQAQKDAQAAIDEIESRLTDQQKDRLVGIGYPDKYISADEYKDASRNLADTSVYNSAEAAEAIANDTIRLSGKDVSNPDSLDYGDKLRLARVRAVYESAQENGVDTSTLKQETARVVMKRLGYSPSQKAEFASDHPELAKGLGVGETAATPPAQTAPAQKQLPATPKVPSVPAKPKNPPRKAKSLDEKRRGSESGMVGARPGPKKPIEHQANSEKTQRSNTTPTYAKIGASLSNAIPKGGKVLDYGAGLGKGTDALRGSLPDKTVESYEPSANGWKPDHSTTDSLNNDYDAVVSANVLNVLEPDLRQRVVRDIVSRVKPGGTAVITARGAASVMTAKGRPGGEENSLFVRQPSGGETYQKGFKPGELKTYIEGVIGPDYTVQTKSGIGDTAVVITKKKPAQSVDQMRRGSQSGMAGARPKYNKSASGPAAQKNRDAVDQSGEPSALGRLLSNLFGSGEPYRPSVGAVVKQGLRSDFAIGQEAAEKMASREGKSNKETVFAAEGGLNPSQRPAEMARRTRQIRDVLDDTIENGPRDKDDKPLGPGLKESFAPITEDARIGGRKLTNEEIRDHYQISTEAAAARRVVSRGALVDRQAADDYADAVGVVLDAEAKAKNAGERKAAAKMRAELPNTKADIDAKAAERKNNIIGYWDKAAGESDVDVAKTALKEMGAAYPDTWKQIKDVGDRMESYARSVLKYAVSHGRLSQEQYDNIVNSEDFYTPLKQLVDSEMGASLPGAGKPNPLGKAAAVTKRFGYGEKEGLVENPFAEIVSQTERIVREVERNKVMKAFYDLAGGPNTADIAEQIPGNKVPRRQDGSINEAGMKKEGIVTVYVDGKPKYLKFSTKERFGQSLAKMMTNFDSRDNTAMQVANFLTGVQKRLITLHPGFAATQLIRDRLERFVLSQHIDPKKELQRAFTKPDAAQLSREKRFPSGQTAQTYVDEQANYKQILEKVLTEAGVRKKGAMYYIKAPKKVYEHVLSMGERQNRRTEFRAAYDYAKGKGLDDYESGLYASSQSTKLQDFTEKGTIARYVLDPLIPFYSASVEGVSRGAAALRRDPLRTGAKALLLGAVPAFALMQEREKNGTVKDLFEFPVYQRATGYLPDAKPEMDNSVPWLPKPHATAFLSAVIEHQYALDWADRGIKNEAERKAFKERVAKSMKETMLALGSPVDVESVFSSGPVGLSMELYFNRNVYGDREIVPHGEKQVPVSQRPGREGKSPLVANPTNWINKRIPPEKWQDARFVEFALEKFLGRWMTGAENLSRIVDPEEKRKALETQSFFRKLFPLIKDEPGPFSTSMLELERGVREATPVNPSLKQRVIKGRMGPAAPDTMTKRRIYKGKKVYYDAATNEQVSAAAKKLRDGIPDRRFVPGSIRRAVKLPPPVPTRKESERKKRALNELLNRRD